MAKLKEFFDRFGSASASAGPLLEECLARIRDLDPELKAWVEVHPLPALSEGPLSGVPFAAKDIFETRELATEYGSPLYSGRKGNTDAALVTRLRNLGAILVGKTETTAFAYFDPAPTRNPHNPAHTPGGSSSGSAAAVAAGMVPFALGTQTGGSVIRPASYCGIGGFKPSFGTLSLEGVMGFAPSLDTAGLFTEDAKDMLLLWQQLGYPKGAGSARRLITMPVPERVESPMRETFAATTDRLRAAGFTVECFEPPDGFSTLAEEVAAVMDYEGARTHRKLWETHGEKVGAKLSQLIVRGLERPRIEYEDALARIRAVKRNMEASVDEASVILTPAALGPAPRGLESTGSPVMNAPWTGLGVPAVTIPMGSHQGLPLGLQMTSLASNETLLETAAAVEAALQAAG